MVSAAYTRVLNHISQTESAQTHGFRAAMKSMAAEYDSADDWFHKDAGSFKPAAYRIDQREGDLAHVHIYEICLGARMPAWKLSQYACWADGWEFAHLSLHIIASFGNEVILDNDILQCLMYGDPFAGMAAYFAQLNPVISTPYAGLIIGGPANKRRLGAGLSLKQKKNAAFAALKDMGFNF